MYYRFQKTIRNDVSCEGIGVHSGQPTQLLLKPASRNQGILFRHRETGEIVRATWESVQSTFLSTTLASPLGRRLMTVEHLLAACYGLGVTNLIIEFSGEEMPIYDGSAAYFVEALLSGQIVEDREETSWIVIKDTITVSDGERFLKLSPAPEPVISMTLPIGGEVVHHHLFHPWNDSFSKDIAPARTFAQLEDVEKLKAAGMIKGGSLDCALVLHQGKPVNAEGFRMPNECARHKILDILGDFALLGHGFFGKIEGYQSGHTLNHQAIRQLLSRADAFTICTFRHLPISHTSCTTAAFGI